MSIYAMFRSLAQGRVGPGGVAGPLRIAQVAYDTARSSVTDLIHFLGILSINLAVINFLPIPPLDGGQMLFLAAEKIRGRPLPDSALMRGDPDRHLPRDLPDGLRDVPGYLLVHQELGGAVTKAAPRGAMP